MPKTMMSVEMISELWPDALNIRHEGRCDVCRRIGLWTFQLPDDAGVNRGMNEEQCGYWCAYCGFSNAGTRTKELP